MATNKGPMNQGLLRLMALMNSAPAPVAMANTAISNTRTGTTSTNTALTLTASGGTTNYALQFTGNINPVTTNTSSIGDNTHRIFKFWAEAGIELSSNNNQALRVNASGAEIVIDAVNARMHCQYGFRSAPYTGGNPSDSTDVLFQAGSTPGYFLIKGAGANAANSAIQFAGSTSSFPMLVRSGTTLSLKLADGTSGGTFDLSDGANISAGTTTGTKIGTATTQKLGLWNATPIVQPTTGVASATRSAGAGTSVLVDDTFDGYTLAQIVKALRNIGALA